MAHQMASKKGKVATTRNTLSAPSSNLGIKRTPDTWREASTAAQCLSHLCLSEHLSDISFSFSVDKSVKLPAHKFVLSMRSAVFEAMFYGSLSEKEETVLIKDVNPEVMRTVLRYVYFDKPNIDGKNVLPCLYTAKKYSLSGLVKQCSDFLQKNIDETNVCQIIEQAVFYEMNPLQGRCLAFIMENASNVLSSQGFIELSQATLLNILKSDELASDEIDVFNAAMRWAEHHCESRSGQNMRDQLGEALFQIRFPNIPIEEFAQVVTPSGILTNEEIVMLYQFNATKGLTPLGKFRQEKRSGAPVTVDINKFKYNQQHMGQFAGCVLNIQGYDDSFYFIPCNLDKRQVETRSKSPKLEYVTGTFVGKVKGISASGGHIIEKYKITDYKTNGDKLIFSNPINICGNTNVDFHFSEEVEGCYQMGYFPSSHVTYHCNISETIKGQNITITSIPDGLETVSFVYI